MTNPWIVRVIGLGLDVNSRMHRLARRRLSFALSRFGPRVRSVSVRLADMNGPRGGFDKRCAMEALLTTGESVRVEDTHPALPTAIGRTTERLARAVARTLARRREPAPWPGDEGGIRA